MSTHLDRLTFARYLKQTERIGDMEHALGTVDGVRVFRDTLKAQREQVESLSADDVRENLHTWQAVEEAAGDLHDAVRDLVEQAEGSE